MKAILARTTADKIKSRILSPQLAEITLEVYISPIEFAELIEKYFESEFEVDIHD
jgi:hypothetical protein